MNSYIFIVILITALVILFFRNRNLSGQIYNLQLNIDKYKKEIEKLNENTKYWQNKYYLLKHNKDYTKYYDALYHIFANEYKENVIFPSLPNSFVVNEMSRLLNLTSQESLKLFNDLVNNDDIKYTNREHTKCDLTWYVTGQNNEAIKEWIKNNSDKIESPDTYKKCKNSFEEIKYFTIDKFEELNDLRFDSVVSLEKDPKHEEIYFEFPKNYAKFISNSSGENVYCEIYDVKLEYINNFKKYRDTTLYVFKDYTSQYSFDYIIKDGKEFIKNELFGVEAHARYKLIEESRLTESDLKALAKAEVVQSNYGLVVQFSKISGGIKYIPLDSKSKYKLNDNVDVTKGRILTYSNGKDEFYRWLED